MVLSFLFLLRAKSKSFEAKRIFSGRILNDCEDVVSNLVIPPILLLVR
jgi:hypothetical protein